MCPQISPINPPNTGNEDGRVKVSEAIAGANVVYTLEHGLPFQYVLNRDGMGHLLYNLAGLCEKTRMGYVISYRRLAVGHYSIGRGHPSLLYNIPTYIRASAEIMHEHSSTSMIFSHAFLHSRKSQLRFPEWNTIVCPAF